MEVGARKIHFSLGSVLRSSVDDALQVGYRSQYDMTQVQICPQNNRTRLTPGVIDEIMDKHQGCKFRLHANVYADKAFVISNLADSENDTAYWDALTLLNKQMGSPDYSAHPGKLPGQTIEDFFDQILRQQDRMGCRVAVEGMYPVKGHWLTSWREYERLLDAEVFYAIDLSHLNIIAKSSRHFNHELTQALVSNSRCLEVHVSANDGSADQHLDVIDYDKEVWSQHFAHIHPDTIIFSEGRQHHEH